MIHEDSPYFGVVCQRPAGSKVAPGMEVTYLILFTPDEKKVYIPDFIFYSPWVKLMSFWDKLIQVEVDGISLYI